MYVPTYLPNTQVGIAYKHYIGLKLRLLGM